MKRWVRPPKNPALEDVDFYGISVKDLSSKTMEKVRLTSWKGKWKPLFYTTKKVLRLKNKCCDYSTRVRSVRCSFFLRGPNSLLLWFVEPHGRCHVQPWVILHALCTQIAWRTCRWPKRGRHEVPCSISSMELVNESAISQKRKLKGINRWLVTNRWFQINISKTWKKID